MDCRTKCTYCHAPVPILSSQCVADGRAGLLHVECAKALCDAGWSHGMPMPPRELVDAPEPDPEREGQDAYLRDLEAEQAAREFDVPPRE